MEYKSAAEMIWFSTMENRLVVLCLLKLTIIIIISRHESVNRPKISCYKWNVRPTRFFLCLSFFRWPFFRRRRADLPAWSRILVCLSNRHYVQRHPIKSNHVDVVIQFDCRCCCCCRCCGVRNFLSKFIFFNCSPPEAASFIIYFHS